MKLALTFTALLFVATAHAAEVCTLTTTSPKGHGSFDQQLMEQEITFEETTDNAYFVYVKPDGSIVRLRYEQVLNKKDFSDLNHSVFFTFRFNSATGINIGYGDVDITRREVRTLKVDSYGGDSRLAVIFGEKFWASCVPR